MKPLVSIIIPIYNVEKYIKACLDSVVNQTMRDVEIICVDDCGTDGSMDIARSYAKQDDRIKIIYNSENLKQGGARNRGLSIATGEYIYFIDADDYVDIHALEILYRIANGHNADIVFFDGMVVNEYADTLGFNYTRKNTYEIQSGRALFDKFIQNGEWRSPVPMQFYSHKFLNENEIVFKEHIIYEDELFTFLCCCKAECCVVIKEALYFRVVREHSTMTSPVSTLNLKSYALIIDSLGEYLKENSQEAAYDARYAYCGMMLNNMLRLVREHPDLLQDTLYDNFQGKNIVNMLLGTLSQEIYFSQDEIQAMHNHNVVIYGAGKFAKKVILKLQQLDIEIEKVVVTQKDNNVNKIFGYTVTAIDSQTENSDKVIILSVASVQLQAELEENAKNHGYKMIFAPNRIKDMTDNKK